MAVNKSMHIFETEAIRQNRCSRLSTFWCNFVLLELLSMQISSSNENENMTFTKHVQNILFPKLWNVKITLSKLTALLYGLNLFGLSKERIFFSFFLNKWIILEYIMREWAKNGFIMQIEFVTIAFIYIYIRRGSRFITQHSPFMKFVYFFRQR